MRRRGVQCPRTPRVCLHLGELASSLPRGSVEKRGSGLGQSMGRLLPSAGFCSQQPKGIFGHVTKTDRMALFKKRPRIYLTSSIRLHPSPPHTHHLLRTLTFPHPDRHSPANPTSRVSTLCWQSASGDVANAVPGGGVPTLAWKLLSMCSAPKLRGYTARAMLA